MTNRVSSIRPRGRRAVILALGVLAAALAGCGGGSSSSDSLTGKVIVNGQPVVGEVVLVGSDNKEIATPIALDGTYLFNNPPKGEAKFLVRSFPAPPAPPPGGAKDAPPPTKSSGVQPPVRYARPGNGLTFTVTGGKQTYDLPLTP